MDCVDIYLANAFCAWDGGYLITETQWERAVHGVDQRTYAWGDHVPDSLDYSVHCLTGSGTWDVNVSCSNPANPMPFDVGHSPASAGMWGTQDLQGNLMNLVTDDSGDMPVPCTNDCVTRTVPDPNRSVARGIAFLYPNENMEPTATYANMINTRPVAIRKGFDGSAVGFRCAYPNDWK
jgi:formylglycine-generating enzyme required for sulfatase activity